MIKTIKPSILFFIILFGISINIFAQTFEDAYKPFWYIRDFGASSSAMAFNTTAFSSGISALATNPANMGLSKQNEILLSFQNGYFNQNSKLKFDNNYTSTSNDYFRFDGFGFLYSVPVYRGSLVFGLSYAPSTQYHTLLNYSGSFKNDDYYEDYYFKEEIKETGSLNALRLGTSLEYRKNLFIGFSVNSYNGFREYNFIGFDTLFTDNSQLGAYETFEPNFRGWNMTFGTLYKFSYFKWGFSASTPLKLKVREEGNISWFYREPQYEESESNAYGPIEYEIKLPWKISSGISFLHDDLEITMDFSTINWHGLEFSSDIVDSISIDPAINNEIHTNLKNTIEFGFGLYFPVFNAFNLQLGYRIIPRPFFDLGKEEKNLNLFGIGTEFFLDNQIKINLAYQLLLGRKSIYNSFFETTTTQKYQDHQFTISTSLMF